MEKCEADISKKLWKKQPMQMIKYFSQIHFLKPNLLHNQQVAFATNKTEF